MLFLSFARAHFSRCMKECSAATPTCCTWRVQSTIHVRTSSLPSIHSTAILSCLKRAAFTYVRCIFTAIIFPLKLVRNCNSSASEEKISWNKYHAFCLILYYPTRAAKLKVVSTVVSNQMNDWKKILCNTNTTFTHSWSIADQYMAILTM